MEKTFGGPNSFFHHPVPVIYSNPWSHKSRQNFPGPQKFFSTILSQSHIRTPGPTKADKTFQGPKSFFPRSHKSRQNFPGPQKVFSAILSQSHIRTPGPTKADKTFRGPNSSSVHAQRTHTLGQTPTSQPDLPTLIISYFNLNFPEVQFRIPKLKVRPPKYYNFTRYKGPISPFTTGDGAHLAFNLDQIDYPFFSGRFQMISGWF